MPLQSVLIKPVSGACDMGCTYCFYRDETENRAQASYGRMSEEVLGSIIKKTLLQARGPVCFAFQGGEPTLRGLPFFEKAMELERRYNARGVQVANTIQTNGFGLDEAWCRFFRDHRFLVGISLDGTQQTHDTFRRTMDGAGTYDRVRSAISLLQNYGVQYNILTVVNSQTAANIKDIYKYYSREGWLYQQYITCLDPLRDPWGQQDYSLIPQAYGQFLKELFDLWYRDWRRGKAPVIRQFENYILMLRGREPESCEQRGICSLQGVFEADGGMYPCDFYVLDEYRMGSILEERIPELLEKPAAKAFLATSTDLSPACKSCSYYSLCRGGCRRSRVRDMENGGQISRFCRSYRMFFDYTIDRLCQIAKQEKT